MCKAFSCLVLENGSIEWKFGVDSHEDLIKAASLSDDGREQSFVRVEIAPENGSYLAPDVWEYRVDQDRLPAWYKPEYAEKMARKAHAAWKKKLYKILIRKPIVHPFKVKPKKVAAQDIANLKKWASVGASVGASVWDSVWASVRDSVGASVGASVWASVRDSVWASAGAYVGSFFALPRKAWKYTDNIKCSGYPFAPAVKLWERGFVPSFDGKTWRLHAGEKAAVVYEWTPEKVK